MKLRTHSNVIQWPPSPGGLDKDLKSPFNDDEGEIEQLFLTVGSVVRFAAAYRGAFFTYDLATRDVTFARRVAKLFSRNLGKTIEELGELELE